MPDTSVKCYLAYLNYVCSYACTVISMLYTLSWILFITNSAWRITACNLNTGVLIELSREVQLDLSSPDLYHPVASFEKKKKKPTFNQRLSPTVQLRLDTCWRCLAPAAAGSQLACRHAGDDASEQPAGRPHAALRLWLRGVRPAHAPLGSQRHSPPRPQDGETVSCPGVRGRQEQLNRYNAAPSLMRVETFPFTCDHMFAGTTVKSINTQTLCKHCLICQ